MAHKGKTYPVHFRRDTNLGNVTNNKACARAYNVTFAEGAGILGDVLWRHPLVAIAVNENDGSLPHWKSDPVTLSGRTVWCDFHWLDNPISHFTGVAGTLHDLVAGRLADFVASAPYGASQGFYRGSMDPRTFDNPQIYFTSSPYIVSLDAVKWEQWNAL